MENSLKLKERILDSAIDVSFGNLVKLHLQNKLPKTISLNGIDVTSRTRMALELEIKFSRHDIHFFTQKVEGAKLFDVRKWYLEGFGKVWAAEIYPSLQASKESYVVVEGGVGSDRESVVRGLELIPDVFAYTENQYPDGPGKITLDLAEYFNHLAIF